MNKQTTMIVAAVVVVLVIIGAYFMWGRSTASQSSQGSEYTTSNSMTPQPQTGMQSLNALVAAGTPVSCTFSDSSSGNETTGTVYVGGGNVRGDFDSTVNGKMMMSHMIMMNQTDYLWTDGNASGFKMAMNGSTPSSSTSSSQGVDPNKNLNYSCQPWVVASDEFSLPSGVTFADMNAMMGNPNMMHGTTMGTNAPQASGDMEPPRCAECNKLPAGSARDQCRAALKCT